MVLAPAASIALANDGVLTLAALSDLGGKVACVAWDLIAALVTRQRLASWRFWAFVYVAFTVGSSIQLSRPDLAHAGRGLRALAALLLLVNLATLWTGDFATRLALSAARFCASYYAVMLLVVTVTIVAVVLVFALPLGLRGAWGAIARIGRASGARS